MARNAPQELTATTLDPLEKRANKSLISLKKTPTFRSNVQSKWRSVSSSIGRWTPVAAQWTKPESCGQCSCIERSSRSDLLYWSDPHDITKLPNPPPQRLPPGVQQPSRCEYNSRLP